MKKGMVYIEAIISSIIAVTLIVSISRLMFTASKILEDTREKGRALDIVRGVGSIYRSEMDITTGTYGLEVGRVSDIYTYVESGIKPKGDMDFTLYTENEYSEGIYILKIKIVSNKQRFKDIKVVIAK